MQPQAKRVVSQGQRTYRCRIARLNGGTIQTVTYIGPVDRVPSGWSMVMRRVVSRTAL